jgi:hypothetical protein
MSNRTKKSAKTQLSTNTVTIGLKTYTLLRPFKVYHYAWEGDYRGWIGEEPKTGKRVIITTSHGGYRISNEGFILEQIKQAEEHIIEMNEVLLLVK